MGILRTHLQKKIIKISCLISQLCLKCIPSLSSCRSCSFKSSSAFRFLRRFTGEPEGPATAGPPPPSVLLLAPLVSNPSSPTFVVDTTSAVDNVDAEAAAKAAADERVARDMNVGDMVPPPADDSISSGLCGGVACSPELSTLLL